MSWAGCFVHCCLLPASSRYPPHTHTASPPHPLEMQTASLPPVGVTQAACQCLSVPPAQWTMPVDDACVLTSSVTAVPREEGQVQGEEGWQCESSRPPKWDTLFLWEKKPLGWRESSSSFGGGGRGSDMEAHHGPRAWTRTRSGTRTHAHTHRCRCQLTKKSRSIFRFLCSFGEEAASRWR